MWCLGCRNCRLQCEVNYCFPVQVVRTVRLEVRIASPGISTGPYLHTDIPIFDVRTFSYKGHNINLRPGVV